MKTQDCERYIEDPEANAAHLASCEECRALFGEHDVAIEPRPIRVEALPLAPWEGAQHRAWPLVAGVTLAVFAIALALVSIAGSGAVEALRASVPSVNRMQAIVMVMRQTPVSIAVVLFLAVNSLLFVLLRRAPKGIDVQVR
jgi:hypothetical protein